MSTSLSTRVDAKLKAKLLERAAELGIPPSKLLKGMVEDYLGRASGLGDHRSKPKPQEVPSLRVDRLLHAASSVGTFRMRRCKYNIRGVCHLWLWRRSPTTHRHR